MIEIINLTKWYDKKIVLNNFSAVFSDGINCLMGDSGAGKTTLAHMLMGLVKADSGEIDGVRNKRINCVFQENRLIEELSAFKNVMLVCGKEKKTEALDLLDQLGLDGYSRYAVATQSGGMKRRVSIARALINPADIYIFDEPFEGLDNARKDAVISIIKERTRNALSIFITHDASDAKNLNAKIVTIARN